MNTHQNDTSVTTNFGNNAKLSYFINRERKKIVVTDFKGIPDDDSNAIWDAVRQEMGVFDRKGFEIVLDEMNNAGSRLIQMFQHKVCSMFPIESNKIQQ